MLQGLETEGMATSEGTARKQVFDRSASIVLQYAEIGLTLIQNSNSKMSSMPNGYNGPHYALETPVRNTSHWIIIFLVAHKLSQKHVYRDSAVRLARWLLDSEYHLHNGIYVHRQKGDWSNGVIGPAWVLESLSKLVEHNIFAGKATNIGNRIVTQHRFSHSAGGWHRFDPNTRTYGVDYTFDHQAWFAASVCQFGRNDLANRFLDACFESMRLRKNGRINHLHHDSSIKGLLLQANFWLKSIRKPNWVDTVEEAYHLYSLFPFAVMRKYCSGHAFYKSDCFKSALEYCSKIDMKNLEHNQYGFSYNAPGFELPLIHHEFGEEVNINSNDVVSILDKQVAFIEENINDYKRVPDPVTLLSRVYELALYCDRFEESRVEMTCVG